MANLGLPIAISLELDFPSNRPFRSSVESQQARNIVVNINVSIAQFVLTTNPKYLKDRGDQTQTL